MDGPGFHVDVDALERSSAGIARTVQDQERRRLKDLCAGPEVYGDVTVHRAMQQFCERWSDGLDLLVDDAEKVSEILAAAARAYRAADAAGAARLRGDPGTTVTDG